MADELERLRNELAAERAARVVAEKRADDEKRRADIEAARNRETTFFEYLDNTYTQIYSVLDVETNPRRAALGKAANVNAKMYPRLLRRWEEFPLLHRQTFDSLTTLFGDKRLFDSSSSTKAAVNNLSPGKRRDEQDIRPYIRLYLEHPSMRIVRAFLKLTDDPRYARTEFLFSNNGLGTVKRHTEIDAIVAAASSGTKKSTRLPKSSSLKPDRWGQRIRKDGSTSDAAIVQDNILPGEYKAVHKVRGSVFRNILGNRETPLAETFIDDCAQRSGRRASNQPLSPKAGSVSTELKKTQQEEVTLAEVLCQAYHYMISFGNTYGYATSGEATAFLMADRADPGTLLYHLVDHEEVAVPITQPESDLVRLPVAQMVTLALLALLDETRPELETKVLEKTLPRWPELLSRAANNDSVLDEPLGRSLLDRDDNDNDERGNNRNSGMPPPPPPPPPPPSSTPRHPTSSSAGAGGTGSGSRRSTSNPADLPAPEYCTQACLLGLCRGGPLDLACPNVREHATAARSKRGPYNRTAYHAISSSELYAILLEQLTDNLGVGLECLARYGLWGSIGTLFKITLSGYGYTFVAKGVQDADEMTLKEEAALYMDDATQNLQGVLMPVYLGCIDLHERPYLLSTGAQIWHMMLLSWAGWSFERQMPNGLDEAAVDDIVDDMYWELCRHGIYHYDLRDVNLAWNTELGHVMALDFDRAVIMTQDEYNEKTLPRVTSTYLGAPLEIESKFQANRREKERLEAKLAASKAEPMAALPASPEAQKRKHRSDGDGTAEQKRILRRNGAALDLDEPAKT